VGSWQAEVSREGSRPPRYREATRLIGLRLQVPRVAFTWASSLILMLQVTGRAYSWIWLLTPTKGAGSATARFKKLMSSLHWWSQVNCQPPCAGQLATETHRRDRSGLGR
jgi:hypothetical protein